MPKPLRLLAAALFLCFALTACNSEEAPPAEALPVETYLPLSLAGHTIQAQIAITLGEQSRGLMYRPTLAPDHGMLFVYRAPQGMSFWMKNTVIPLDIGFFDAEGILREVYPMYPRDTRGVRSRSQEIQFALEMNQGWFAQAKVQPGARLDLETLAAALRARGAKPSDYGL